VLFPLLLRTARTCTQVLVRAPEGQVVVANTVEDGDFVELHGGKFVHLILRGDKLGGGTGHACGGDCATSPSKTSDSQSVAWCTEFTAKYGFVGGMNEKGLSVGHHMLALSVYEPKRLGKPGICARDVDAWLLSSFASVAELSTVLASSDRVRIIADPHGVPDPITYTWGVVDATGAAVVVEFVKGIIRVHNNSAVGVLTNDPTWEWHVENLNNFVALQPTWYDSNNQDIEVPVSDPWYAWQTQAYNTLPPAVPTPIGHAFNLLGLPGDGSGASRFVRMFFQRAYAQRANAPRNLEGALVLAQELLNTVYKVKGTIPGRNKEDPLETTPVATLSVPATREVYHRGRADMTWRKLDLKRIDFTTNATRRHAKVVSPRFFSIDVTKFLTEDHPETALSERDLQI